MKRYQKIGSQRLSRTLRSAAVGDSYYDVDIVDSYGSLLLGLWEVQVLPFCREMAGYERFLNDKRLENLVRNKEKILGFIKEAHAGTNRDDCKALMMRIFFGGLYKNWRGENGIDEPIFIHPRLDSEPDYNSLFENCATWNAVFLKWHRILEEATGVLIESDKGKAKRLILDSRAKDSFLLKTDAKKKHALVSYILQRKENEVLEHMEKFFADHDYQIGSPVFDGLHVGRNRGLTGYEISKLERYVEEKTGMRVSFKIKDWTPYPEGFHMPYFPQPRPTHRLQPMRTMLYNQLYQSISWRISLCPDLHGYPAELARCMRAFRARTPLSNDVLLRLHRTFSRRSWRGRAQKPASRATAREELAGDQLEPRQ